MATISKSVTVVDGGTYTLLLNAIPNGKTVTPINDIQTWLHCGDIWDKSYTTLEEVFADASTLLALISSNNAVDYMVRSTDWAAPTNFVPIMTSYNTPSGEVSQNPNQGAKLEAWRAFDGDDTTFYYAKDYQATNQRIYYHATSPAVVDKVKVLSNTYVGSDVRINNFKIQASNDGTNWTDLTSQLTYNQSDNDPLYITLANSMAYEYYAIFVINGKSAYNFSLNTVQFYVRNTSIANNQTAMGYIGNNNYAANTLLADATWCEAICNSEYFENVLNVKVPTMTSNTAPSGTAFASANDSEAYRAFDGSSGDMDLHTNTGYCGYEFTSNVKIYKAVIKPFGGGYGPKNVKLQAEVNSAYVDCSDVITLPNSNAENVIIPTSIKTSKKWRMYYDSSYSGTNASVTMIQFYGRA